MTEAFLGSVKPLPGRPYWLHLLPSNVMAFRVYILQHYPLFLLYQVFDGHNFNETGILASL